MPIIGKEHITNEDGVDKKAYLITFTNGAYAQLKELLQFLKETGFPDANSEEDVIKLGISILQSAKDKKDEVGTSKAQTDAGEE